MWRAGSLAVGVDLVLAYPEVRGWGRSAGWFGLDPGVVGLQGCAAVERPVRADVIVVVDERVELGLELCEGPSRGLARQVALKCLV
jgi:hypothetical protein